DSTVKYFLFGHLFDMANQHDVTQDRIDENNKVNFSALPLDKAVKVVKGNGSRVFAVFTDPDCPFCKQLEQNLAEVDNYTMYVFMYPIPQLHPSAEEHSNAVWCSSDRGAAWTASMKTGTFPQAKDCKTPTREVMEIGAKIGVQGTPTLFRMDGKRLGGAQPAPQIDSWLNNK
ncbi:MAG: DsbC family protein, partial [Methylococcaceae bacterium]